MSTPSNLATVNIGVKNSTPVNTYFNNYFITPGNVSGDQNSAVTAFFESVTGGNKQSAAVLASTVIYTAMSQGINPMTTVPKGELTLYLAMFLNLNRIGTSLVGVNNNSPQNKYVTRAILA